jgi:uroporphyrinogen-III decarboxylase
LEWHIFGLMTSKERMARAMRREIPDRVPVMCQMSIGHMLLQTGFSPLEFWSSKEMFAEGLIRLRRQYAFDGILVSLHGHAPDWEKGILRVIREEGRETVHWKDGGRTIFPADDLPLHYPAEAKGFPSIADFDPASIPDRLDFIPVSQGLEFNIDPGRPYDIFADIIAAAGRGFSIHGEVTSPFDYFLNLFGFSAGFMALAEEPAKTGDILLRLAEGVAKIAMDQARLGVDAIKISSPYAGAGFLSPRHYREFVLPCERRIAATVQRLGVPAYTHTCGAIGDRLEIMIAAGVSGLECLDPPPLGNVELEEAKRRVGRNVFIKGNIDPVHTLLAGTRETIENDARRRLRIGMPGGGFILSTACSIAPHTPWENVEILASLAADDGGYPHH